MKLSDLEDSRAGCKLERAMGFPLFAYGYALTRDGKIVYIHSVSCNVVGTVYRGVELHPTPGRMFHWFTGEHGDPPWELVLVAQPEPTLFVAGHKLNCSAPVHPNPGSMFAVTCKSGGLHHDRATAMIGPSQMHAELMRDSLDGTGTRRGMTPEACGPHRVILYEPQGVL